MHFLTSTLEQAKGWKTAEIQPYASEPELGRAVVHTAKLLAAVEMAG
jgi:hypothetical protein